MRVRRVPFGSNGPGDCYGVQTVNFATFTSLGSAMDIELLPRRLIFANPERIIVRISHDGTRIAFLAPVDGVLNLWVGPIARIEDACPVTKATDRNLGPWIVWM